MRWRRVSRRSTSAAAATCPTPRYPDGAAAGEAAALRFRVPGDAAVAFDDGVRGHVHFEIDVIGDFVMLRSDGSPAYNFAVVVDDGLMGVTDVIRGEDHISNTPRQLLLYKAFGWSPPRFAHLALVLGPDHAPLSKRHGATSVAEFRAKGYLPESLANYLALVGWSPGGGDELLPLDELARRFSLDGVSHSAGVFDEEKLAWANRHYLKAAPVSRLVTLALPYLRHAGFVADPSNVGLETWQASCRLRRNRSIGSIRSPIDCGLSFSSTRPRRPRGPRCGPSSTLKPPRQSRADSLRRSPRRLA